MLTTLAVENYRSLRHFVVPLKALNVITGPNGSGKSSVYRALRLLSETAQGTVIPSLAREGGLRSTLWAGPEEISRAMRAGEQPVQSTMRKNSVYLRLGFSSDDFGYAIDLGMPILPDTSAFVSDPAIKRERLWHGPVLRPSSTLITRDDHQVQRREKNGSWNAIVDGLASFESMMTEYADVRAAPEMAAVRRQIRSWRFYDHFRTDSDAPARAAQVGTHSPVLSNDGGNVAAALETIREIGDVGALNDAVDDAFPGARVSVVVIDGRFELEMRQKGLLRPLKGAELSDGTLRYLLWIAALLTPRPPSFLVLNEPETSLHPDLLPALARLIARAAKHTQICMVSHADKLMSALKKQADCHVIRLTKSFGETTVHGQHSLEQPPWNWPSS